MASRIPAAVRLFRRRENTQFAPAAVELNQRPGPFDDLHGGNGLGDHVVDSRRQSLFQNRVMEGVAQRQNRNITAAHLATPQMMHEQDAVGMVAGPIHDDQAGIALHHQGARRDGRAGLHDLGSRQCSQHSADQTPHMGVAVDDHDADAGSSHPDLPVHPAITLSPAPER